jgi:transcriptional regulator with XRE-family HTH domain
MAEVPDITTAVARTLKALRADRGWSLDQLAARSGVSKGVLVALEQGRSNPNLTTLARIGDAFGVPVTQLVDVGGEPAVRISGPDAARVLWRGPSGGTGTILGATDPPWAVELWRWEVMPGEQFGGDPHAPATREMVWVQTGRLTLTVGGEHLTVGPGQSARFPASRPHRYSNEGQEPVELIMVVLVPPAQDLQFGGLDPGVHADEPVTGGDGGPAGAGHVQVGHQSDFRGPGLFLAQHGVGPDLGQEPVTEVRHGLHHAAAQEIGAGVVEVGGDGEQASQRHGLLLEDGQGQGVALLSVATDLLGGLAHGQRGHRVIVVPGEPVRE